MNQNVNELFNHSYIPEPNTGCWIWIGRYMWKGYGVLSFDGGTVRAHRFSWEISKGPIPKNMFICHKCDVRCCVNPNHLFLGTAKDNALDRDAKGRGSNQYKRTDFCKNGHRFDIFTKTQRKCSLCKKASYLRNKKSLP